MMSTCFMLAELHDLSARYMRAWSRRHGIPRFEMRLDAYDDHKRVLELAPSYSDAKLVVGVYTYIVAALPIYERVVAFLLSIKGSKTEGIEGIRQAASAGGEASVDAKTALSLFLARERRYPEALSLMRELYRSYPHNFHFGLSEADLLRSNGDVPEAVTAYRNLLGQGQRNIFPHPRLTKRCKFSRHKPCAPKETIVPRQTRLNQSLRFLGRIVNR